MSEAIERRDGVACDPEDLYMTDGASPAVHYMMDLLLRKEFKDGLMVSTNTLSGFRRCCFVVRGPLSALPVPVLQTRQSIDVKDQGCLLEASAVLLVTNMVLPYLS